MHMAVEMKLKSKFVSKKINQTRYKPMIKFIEAILKREGVTTETNHAAHLLTAIAVSFCEPHLFDSRITAMLDAMGAENFEIMEFKDLVNKVKQEVEATQ